MQLMRFRGHIIGALAFSIAGASALAADEHVATWIRIEGFATADQLLAELSQISQLHAAR